MGNNGSSSSGDPGAETTIVIAGCNVPPLCTFAH
jgi:hypothetical protein